VTGFRQTISFRRESVRNVEKYPCSLASTFKPSKRQPSVNTENLKPIHIEDMGLRDAVFKGYILSCKIIELPTVWTGTYTLIEDEQGQVEKIGLYGFGFEDDREAKQLFWIGKRISIIHPYMRMGMDGKPYIRVDNPSTVISHHDTPHSVCALCQSDTEMRCQRCLATFYCSKRCQEIDWKIFKHKLICS